MRQGLTKLRPLGHATLTVSTTATALSAASIPPGTCAFYMQADANPVRWTADGSTPVAGSVGMIARTGLAEQFYPFHPGAMRFVREGAADGTILVTFLGE